MCLTAVSGWLARLQRAGDALPHAHEAVGIERELAAAHPGRDSWRLPTALSSLADVLSRLGRDTEAAEARTQAAARTSA